MHQRSSGCTAYQLILIMVTGEEPAPTILAIICLGPESANTSEPMVQCDGMRLGSAGDDPRCLSAEDQGAQCSRLGLLLLCRERAFTI
jgi:hypothetical protein